MHRFASCRRLQFRTGQISSQRSFQHSRRFHYQSTKKASNLGLVGLATGVALTVGGLLWYNDERLEAQSDQGTKKTESESLQIMTGIQTNRLVRLLDAQQKNSMIQHMVPIEFEAGQLLCQLGDVPNYFYILESGECEVYNSKNDIIHTLSPGESFGENGFVLFTKRSATIKAKSKVRVWAIDRQTFMKKVLPSSKRLRETFEKYASESKPDGKHMTHDDFVNSLSEIERISGEDTRRLKFLFELADTDKNGSLGFTEFALFDLIASRPDAEFEIAFRVFDTNNNGMISKSDVIKTLRESEEHEGFKFDENCSLMKRFFGDRGERRLRAEEFAQFFVSLTDEIPKQLFQYYDKEQKGYLSQRQFEKLVQDFGYGSWRMPDGIKKRLLEVRSLHKDDKIITFGQFVAFNEFLNHIPALDKVVKDACLKKGSSITQDEFKVACQSVANNISPLEVNVIFTIFDTNRDGRINYSDFKCITQLGRLCSPEELMRLTRPPSSSSSSSNKIQHEKKTFWDYASETVQHFGLGGIAGGIGATAVYPIDLVKTRMQNQRAISVHERLYKNSIDCFLKVIKNEGPMGLYRGLLPQLMGVSPEKAIKLTVNDLLRSYFRDEAKGKIYLPLEILAGCGAGASQVIFTNPIEIVKIRLQIQGETSKMVQDYKPKSAVTMVRELGIRGLYRGAGACLLRDIPFSGIYFPTYAKMKTVLADEDGKNSNWSLLLAGALAGIPAAALVTPADVVKTRLQVEARKGEATYSGIIDCAKKVYQAEGFKAFWKGALARVLRSSPQFGVTLVSYEMLQRWLSPELEPRPPTNAPVTGEELEAMRRLGSLQQVKRLEKMVKSNEK